MADATAGSDRLVANLNLTRAGGMQQPRNLLRAGAIVICLLFVLAIIAVILATRAVDDAAVRNETVRAVTAVHALVRDGYKPGPAMATRLSDDFNLKSAHFLGGTAAGGDEAVIAVPASEGGPATLAWTPVKLGTEMAWALAPARLAISALVVLVTSYILFRLYRLALELEGLRRTAREAADRDALTALGSRLAFDEGLRQLFETATPRVGLFYLDLDGFKAINDTLGHAAGDQLLRLVAERIAAAAGENDLVVRLGGDEFAIIRPEPAARADLMALARTLTQRLKAPYLLGGVERQIGASIGIALSPDDGDNPHALMIAADRALYRAKSTREPVVFAGRPERKPGKQQAA